MHNILKRIGDNPPAWPEFLQFRSNFCYDLFSVHDSGKYRRHDFYPFKVAFLETMTLLCLIVFSNN